MNVVIRQSLVLLMVAAALSAFPAVPGHAEFDFYANDLIGKESYRRISMDFQDASLKTVLKIFSEQAGLNFIAAQNVQDRQVTLFLKDVPLQEALNKIMAANNLTYDLDPAGNIFVVKEWGRPDVETVTKIFPLKYTRLQGSRMATAIDNGATAASSADAGTADSGGGGGAAGGGEAGGTTGGIEESIKSVLTTNGKVAVDFRTNSLIITDIPSQFGIIEKLIALLDTLTPQIMIEVEMLDVSKRTIDEMGFDTTSSLMKLTGGSTQTKFPNFMADGDVITPSEFTYGTLGADVFTAVLDLLTTDTRTKFLARPRILTLSNETAFIKITTSEAIGQNTVTSSSEGTATSTVEAERVETGVSLKVTPQVDMDTGIVTMFVQPSVAEAKAGATFANTTYKDPEVRTSASTLRVKSGETIVVGGLIRNKEEVTVKKIPFFGDIPLVGAFFRHKDSTIEDRELIVFITPHVLDYKDAVTLAKGGQIAPTLSFRSHREQATPVARREEVDNMLERWEN
ncbi:MAG: hypothetical protein WC732_07625 [Candidatus Omnitrophota bacterium]